MKKNTILILVGIGILVLIGVIGIVKEILEENVNVNVDSAEGENITIQNQSVSLLCESDSDCTIINSEVNYQSCWPGACEQVDYSFDRYVAVNKVSFEKYKESELKFRPSNEKCGLGPECPVSFINENFDAKCVGGKCQKVPQNILQNPGQEALSNTASSPPPEKPFPVLKNLGINIESWNKQTNLAGDLIFSKKLLFDDGRVSNDKVFIDFGHKEKYRSDDIGSIEYWFFVPLKTKVRAPVDGKVQVVFFNHTQDWGVNFMQEESSWIVSFEHVVNVAVKDNDMVKAGDFIGEAAPRRTFNNEIAMVEFVVWESGKQIVKHCPFLFLEDNLKPLYEEKLKKVANEWEEFIGKDVYQQEKWIAPGCLVEKIVEK